LCPLSTLTGLILQKSEGQKKERKKKEEKREGKPGSRIPRQARMVPLEIKEKEKKKKSAVRSCRRFLRAEKHRLSARRSEMWKGKKKKKGGGGHDLRMRKPSPISMISPRENAAAALRKKKKKKKKQAIRCDVWTSLFPRAPASGLYRDDEESLGGEGGKKKGESTPVALIMCTS